jgi:hypothetical protein
MQPPPEYILDEVLRVLNEVIRPTLAEDYASEQARLMASLLEHVRLRIEHEPRLLWEDASDIHVTLSEVAHDELAARLDSLGAPASDRSLAWLRQYHEDLLDLLQGAVATFETRGASGDSDAQARLQALRAVLRRHLDRQRSIIGPGYAIGT